MSSVPHLAQPWCNGNWTSFYNRDGPTVTGDWETLNELRRENPGEICESPSAFDARTVSLPHRQYYLTGENVTANVNHGLSCLNADQHDRSCMDYEVRFCCPVSKYICEVACIKN